MLGERPAVHPRQPTHRTPQEPAQPPRDSTRPNRRSNRMLLRLSYLGVTDAFALLRLLPRSDHDKDIEILTLRHQIAVLQRQLDGQRIQFQPTDRALLAALLDTLPTSEPTPEIPERDQHGEGRRQDRRSLPWGNGKCPRGDLNPHAR